MEFDHSLLVATMSHEALAPAEERRRVGILARATGLATGGYDFYFCWTSRDYFGLNRAPAGGCSGTLCAMTPMKTLAGVDAVKPIPVGAKVDFPGDLENRKDRFRSMRVSVLEEADGDLVECRVAQIGGFNLQNGTEDYYVRAKVPLSERPAGQRIGLGVTRTDAWVYELDVHGK